MRTVGVRTSQQWCCHPSELCCWSLGSLLSLLSTPFHTPALCVCQVAELDAKLSAALAAWQDGARDVKPPPAVSSAEGPGAEPERALLATVVAADTALRERQAALDAAKRAAGAALERLRQARDRDARCQAAERSSAAEPQPSAIGVPAALVAGRLAGAYRKLAQLHVSEGLLELKVCLAAVFCLPDPYAACAGHASQDSNADW